MSALARTPDEIVAEFHDAKGSDFFGAYRSSLLDGLPFEHATQFLKAGVTADEWEADGSRSHVIATARDYMDFARGKAGDHRGLSAERSIDHFRAWLWLLGMDQRVKWNDYYPYGAPVLKQISELLEMGWPYAPDSDLGRMGAGMACSPNCGGGC